MLMSPNRIMVKHLSILNMADLWAVQHTDGDQAEIGHRYILMEKQQVSCQCYNGY